MSAPSRSDYSAVRNWIAFWIFGVCANFSFTVMLSAAQDILKKDDIRESGNGTNEHCLESINLRHCSHLSTGAVLICNILPQLLLKFSLPFVLHKIPYRVRQLIIVALQVLSLTVTACADSTPVALIGVCFASLAGGMGDMSYLSLTSHYHKSSITAWSCGTGASGILASITYAVMTDKRLLSMSPKHTLLAMLVVPAMTIVTYFLVLVETDDIKSAVQLSTVEEKGAKKNVEDLSDAAVARHTTAAEKLVIIRSLLKYMIPLGLVYFGEYFINQGLVELITFDCAHSFAASPESQYRWYQVIYQVGVFLSRCSISIIALPLPAIMFTAVLQLTNAVLFYLIAVYQFVPHILILIALVLYVGCLGGGNYANTFAHIHKHVAAEDRAFALAVGTMSDTVGIITAALLAIPVHNHICAMPYYQ